jgi:glutamate synthase (NADPH/NADH) large chain
MTAGVAVILGPVGANFAAGMTGGMAFVYDPGNVFPLKVNPDSVIHSRIETEYWEDVVKVLIGQHVRRTHSRFAYRLLNDWELEKDSFWQVVPMEMLDKLEHPVTREDEENLRVAGE